MRLAWRELVRRPGRFLTAGAILTLISLLLMFLGGLLDGLLRASTGAVRAQDADLIVYSESSQASFLRSRIDPALRSEIEGVPGVAEVGGIGLVQLGARVPGNGPRDLAGVAVFGYEIAPDGVPDAVPPLGQAYADDILESDGVEVGMTILVGPARSPIEIIGFVSDTAYNAQGSLWASPETWREVTVANRPGERLADGVFQALVVRTADGVSASDLADTIDATTGEATDTYTIAGAVEAIPGVTEQRRTFNQIIGVTILIALVVVALFFALLTVERTSLYGVLKALGARTSTLFVGLVVQATSVALGAALLAGAAVVVLDLVIPPGAIPLYVTPSRLITSAALLVVAAIAGCAFSLRRVLRVDPASAIGSSQ
ncbi:MAG: ABC transporter permease [Acidimicrobiales bacterium]|nr:ABC transporter permease [Acidimicrobiales bacterium]